MREEQQGAMGIYIYERMSGRRYSETCGKKNGERWITIGVYDILLSCFPMGDKTCAEASEDGWIKRVCVLLE